MNQINSVCVYSASSTKIDAVYFQAADTLGRLLAEHRIRLINGAGSIGLMRSVADAVLANGGEVTGVIPHFMVEQNWHHTGLTELVEVESMHERKQKMAELPVCRERMPELQCIREFHLQQIPPERTVGDHLSLRRTGKEPGNAMRLAQSQCRRHRERIPMRSIPRNGT